MEKFKLDRKQKIVVAIMFLSAFICFFNQTTVNVAYPTIMRQFNIDASIAQWLLSGYLMTVALVVPLNAFLIEKFNLKKLIIIAISIYLLGCILATTSISFYILFFGRILQACGHGIIMPTSMAVLLYIFPVEKRGSMLGFYGLLLGFAPMLGPTFSGFIVDNLGWHYIFIFIGIYVLILIIITSIFMPNYKIPTEKAQKLDIPSLLLSICGLGLILYGCASIGTYGFSIYEIIEIVIGAGIITIFIIRQIKIDNPMLNVKVFKYKNYSVGMFIMALVQLAFMGAVVLFPILIQNVLGYSPTIAGLVLIPSDIIMGLMSPITGKLFDKYGIKILAPVGLLILSCAGLCLSTINAASPIWLLIMFVCIRNLGCSFVMMNINTWGINSLPKNLLPHGNALASTIRFMSMSFASSISTTVYTCVANSYPGGVSDIYAGVQGINASFMYQSVLSIIALIVCLIFVRDQKKN